MILQTKAQLRPDLAEICAIDLTPLCLRMGDYRDFQRIDRQNSGQSFQCVGSAGKTQNGPMKRWSATPGLITNAKDREHD